jgi:hypothetical protein
MRKNLRDISLIRCAPHLLCRFRFCILFGYLSLYTLVLLTYNFDLHFLNLINFLVLWQYSLSYAHWCPGLLGLLGFLLLRRIDIYNDELPRLQGLDLLWLDALLEGDNLL